MFGKVIRVHLKDPDIHGKKKPSGPFARICNKRFAAIDPGLLIH